MQILDEGRQFYYRYPKQACTLTIQSCPALQGKGVCTAPPAWTTRKDSKNRAATTLGGPRQQDQMQARTRHAKCYPAALNQTRPVSADAAGSGGSAAVGCAVIVSPAICTTEARFSRAVQLEELAFSLSPHTGAGNNAPVHGDAVGGDSRR